MEADEGINQERWGKLTDDDVDIINGQNDQLVGTIQERYGIAKAEAQRQYWPVAGESGGVNMCSAAGISLAVSPYLNNI